MTIHACRTLMGASTTPTVPGFSQLEWDVRGKMTPDLSLPPPRLTMQIPTCYSQELTSSFVVWLELIK